MSSRYKHRFQGLFEAPVGLQIRDHSGAHVFTPLFRFIEFLHTLGVEDTVVNKTETSLSILKKQSTLHSIATMSHSLTRGLLFVPASM